MPGGIYDSLLSTCGWWLKRPFRRITGMEYFLLCTHPLGDTVKPVMTGRPWCNRKFSLHHRIPLSTGGHPIIIHDVHQIAQ